MCKNRKRSLIIILLFVCIMLFSNSKLEAVSQKDIGETIASFAINFATASDGGAIWVYPDSSLDLYSLRGSTYQGEKVGGKWYGDCVGWVTFCLQNAINMGNNSGDTPLGGGGDGFVIPPFGGAQYANPTYQGSDFNGTTDYLNLVTDGSLKPGDILMNDHHVMIYVGKVNGKDRIVNARTSPLTYETFEEYARTNYDKSGCGTNGVYSHVYRVSNKYSSKVKKSDLQKTFSGSKETIKWDTSAGNQTENKISWTDYFLKQAQYCHDFLSENNYFYSSAANNAAGAYIADGTSVGRGPIDENLESDPANARAIDCSSYVSWVLFKCGFEDMKGGQHSTHLSSFGAYGKQKGWKIITSPEELQPGDICFYRGGSMGNSDDGDPEHMNIFVQKSGNDYLFYDCGSTPRIRERNPVVYDVKSFRYAFRTSPSPGFDGIDNSGSVNGGGNLEGFEGDPNHETSENDKKKDFRVVDVNDKIAIYKHILFTEKYNFNRIQWKQYGHGHEGNNSPMKEDVVYGLKYPSDNQNVKLGKFVSLVLPYLQTWYIPLGMYSGVLNTGRGTISNGGSGAIGSNADITKFMNVVGSLSAASEAGNAGGAANTGGDGGNACGKYQFDFRYALPEFVPWACDRNPTFYAPFQPYIGANLQSNQSFYAAWAEIFAKDPTLFEADQDLFAKIQYYDPTVTFMKGAYDINLDERSDGLKAALFSAAIRDGAGSSLTQHTSGTKATDTDSVIISRIYSVLRQKHPGTSRWDEEEPRALTMANEYTTKNVSPGDSTSGSSTQPDISKDTTTTDGKTDIAGKSQATVEQMTAYIKKVNPSVAKSVIDMIPEYLKEGNAEGIRGDVAFAQSCIETGNFAFVNTAVTLDQNNFAGMGVTQNGMKGESYKAPLLGIRAQIQHLKAYANKEELKQKCIDTRFSYVSRGSAQYVEWLGIQENPNKVGWAAGSGYGEKILTILKNIIGGEVTNEDRDPSLSKEEEKGISEANSSATNYYFPYSIIKYAYHNIIVNRYDLEKKSINTKYNEYTRYTKYDVATATQTETRDIITNQLIGSLITYGQLEQRVQSEEFIDERADASGNINPIRETYINEEKQISTKYFLSRAVTFDMIYTNDFDYKKYSDTDVANRSNADSQYVLKTEAYYREHANISNKLPANGSVVVNGSVVGPNVMVIPLGGVSTTVDGRYRTTTQTVQVHGSPYTIDSGETVYLKRTWEDKLTQKGSKSKQIGYDELLEFNANEEKDSSKSTVNRKTFETKDNQGSRMYKSMANKKELNLIDLINSNPKLMYTYLVKGAEYGRYTGYSRGYLSMSYGALRKLIDKTRGDDGKVPYAYFTSMGYSVSQTDSDINVDDTGYGGFGWPVDLKGNDQSRIVNAIFPYTPYYGSSHGATDIRKGEGANNIIASRDGTIIKAGRNGGYGVSVFIQHDDGYYTRYSHLSSLASGIAAGKQVKKGEKLGIMGSTGKSTGTHLDFEIYKDGVAASNRVDPLEFFNMEPEYGTIDPNTIRTVDSGYKFKSEKSTGGEALPVIFVGDSRTVGMKDTVKDTTNTYIAKVGKGFLWFNTDAVKQLTDILDKNPKYNVVFAMGVNDCGAGDGSASQYLETYKSLKSKYNSTNFYVMSVNPVEEKSTHNAKQSVIQAFNKVMKKEFASNYIDTYSYLMKEKFTSSDGLHYDNATYQKIYDFVMEKMPKGNGSMGGKEIVKGKVNILLIAGHFTLDRPLLHEMASGYTEPVENRNLVMEIAAALEKEGINAVIANRVLAGGKGDYKDQYGVIWGDEDFRTYRMGAGASKWKSEFAGYDHVIEIHFNAAGNGEIRSSRGAQLVKHPSYELTALDDKLLSCVSKNNGNIKLSPYELDVGDIPEFYSIGTGITYIETEYYDNPDAMKNIKPQYSNIAADMAKVIKNEFKK